MKKIIGTSLLLLSTFFVQAQKNNPNDTITTNYQPSVLFSPLPYTEKGNEFHSANGEPGPKYWQNLGNYKLAVELDTATKTLSGTAEITYVNNSPDALQYLWLQLDQNTYKKDARSNFVTGTQATQHTSGYEIESVYIDYGDVRRRANFTITDTRMQIRLVKPLGKGPIKLVIKYH